MAEPLRLTWRKTWIDIGGDFVAEDPEFGRVGRIHQVFAPTREFVWIWTVNVHLQKYDVWLSDKGHNATKNDAARSTERSFFEALAQVKASHDESTEAERS